MHLLEAGDHHALLHSATAPARRRRVITQSEPEVNVRRRPRVTDGHLGEYIRILRSSPTGASEPASTDEPLGLMDRLREAAEAKTRVLIRIADSQGRERTVEMLPATLNAGRVRGTVTSTGAEASLSIARIISVDPAAPPADGGPAD